MPKYSEIEYPRDESGVDGYPQKLVDYLQFRFFRQKGSILDVGCGKGTYVECFDRRLFEAWGIDKETGFDFENDDIPFPDYFDYIFSKSTLEHIYNTEHVLSEIRNCLKVGGLFVCLVPDWDSQKKIFYNDPTHVHPFTKESLAKALQLAGFKHVHCEKFCSLTFSWEHPLASKFLIPLARLIPGKPNNFVRFAKETMLLCYGFK